MKSCQLVYSTFFLALTTTGYCLALSSTDQIRMYNATNKQVTVQFGKNKDGKWPGDLNYGDYKVEMKNYAVTGGTSSGSYPVSVGGSKKENIKTGKCVRITGPKAFIIKDWVGCDTPRTGFHD